ncbi:MAG: SgcJ/EcaC family oxidoreductase [Luteolibacter sp.]|uniref:YybH family protein n=1 Tax=Luteolibacter sp. TaxID=1962973 RepID=UPI003263141A
MRRHHLILLFALHCAPLHAAEIDSKSAEITKNASAFVEAFHKGDAKAVAAFWTPDGDYCDDTGRELKGRAEIEASFAELFAANKGMKLRIDIQSIRFPSEDVAIEDGSSVVIPPDGFAPSRARYTNVHVKKDGQWLLASVRESADPGPSNFEHLSDLEWTIGEWVDEAPSVEMGHVSFTWAPGRNFIISTRSADFKDDIQLQSTQWIGWNAADKQIRSTSFQADGGTGQSTWTKDGDLWIIKTESILADGGKVSSTNIVTPVDADSITWQSKDQTVNGKSIPDTVVVKMKRAE